MTQEEIHLFLELETTFTFAKSKANMSPTCIYRKYYSDSVFLAAMNHINNNGYKEKFNNKEYTCYNIEDYKYWVITDEKGFDDPNAIINREKI
jgi:hypothetical protein